MKHSKPVVSRAQLRRETISAYLFLLPFLVFFIGFIVIPMFMCLWTSFFDSTMAREDIFVGLGNYITMAQDEIFHKALLNTLSSWWWRCPPLQCFPSGWPRPSTR